MRRDEGKLKGGKNRMRRVGRREEGWEGGREGGREKRGGEKGGNLKELVEGEVFELEGREGKEKGGGWAKTG